MHKGYMINVGMDVKQSGQRNPQYLGMIRNSAGQRIEIPDTHGANYICGATKKECLKRCMNYIDRFLPSR